MDEFPQFGNVIRGDMSLVGWRPCTLGEWEKYDLQHRIRAGMRPGITGIWQTSGRSEITDFDEDAEIPYIDYEVSQLLESQMNFLDNELFEKITI